MSRRTCGLAVLVSALTGSALGDDFTVIHAPPAAERTHAEILSSALGGSFSSAGLNFNNGSISAIRNRDIGGIQSTDQVWKQGSYRAKLVANEEYNRVSAFGYLDRAHNNHDNLFVSVFDTDTVGTRALVSPEHQFRWAIQKTDGEVLTSLNTDQSGRDMMVSYSLFNTLGQTIGSMLFFEDHRRSNNKDFNDIAVLLTLAPTPQAAALGLLGLGGMGVLAGRRRRNCVA